MGPEWTLEKISESCQGSLHGNCHLAVDELAIDSRTLLPSPRILFIALVGERHDGHDYLEELYRSGIRAFLVSRLPDPGKFPGAGFCRVDDTLVALQGIASARREEFAGTVAAVTGSNGKTIVKEWIFQMLRDHLPVYRSPKSYNSQVGVPLSLWMAGPGHDLAVIEAGISRPGEMARLERIIRPRIGLFTHLGTAHQENFRGIREKLQEKLSLFRGCEKLICRSDVLLDTRPLPEYLQEFNGVVADWCLEGDATYRYGISRGEWQGTVVTAQTPYGQAEFRLPFSDDASIENALHAFTFSLESGMPLSAASIRIGELEPVNMRLEMLRGIHRSILINDTYNSDTGGLLAALDLADQQESSRGTAVILSDLLQSGMAERELYSEIASILRRRGIQQFIGIGPAMLRNRELFGENALFYNDTGDFLERADRNLFRERTVLVKGSRSFGFERITADLQQQTHQTVLEIDLNAMVSNLNYFRSLLAPGVRTMVMVKALSYGTGSAEIAGLLQFHQVDYLAVAFIDEGVQLRKAGIHLPILVLNPDPAGFGVMTDYRLEPELYSFRVLEAFYAHVRYRGLDRYPVHIKIDTGMHRLGFMEEDLEDLIPMLIRPEFRIASVFSHLSASDEPEHDEFSSLQFTRFDRITGSISGALDYAYLKHMLNSAGIERFPGAQYDMVRLGIGLHGIGRSGSLSPVSTFRTSVSQVRKVPPGETVGYSRSGPLERETLVATIPVGYADGMDRRLGNGTGRVWVSGMPAPTIGNICMDMTMVDVTGLRVAEGDPVEVFGKSQTAGEVAARIGTIPYELLTSIPERVKRVYLHH